MKKTIIILSAFALIAGSCGQPAKKQAETTGENDVENNVENIDIRQHGGIYAFGEKNSGAPYGTVYIYPETDSTVLFYLFESRGAPSYNMGEIDGRITVKNGQAVFRKRYDSFEKDCELRFEFNGDTLTVIEDDDNSGCPFGYGVYVNDTFERTTSEIPEYYTNLSNEKIYFSEWQDEEILSKDELDEQAFTSLFPDMIFGKPMEHGQPIPEELAEKYLSEFPIGGDSDYRYKGWYAVGKIIGHNGLDIYLCAYDESIKSPNDKTFTQTLFFFKTGIPLTSSENERLLNGESLRVMNMLNAHWVEILDNNKNYEGIYIGFFDTDTSLIQKMTMWNEELNMTGYLTIEESRYRIDEDARYNTIENIKQEYSSPFYDCNFLKEQNFDDETIELLTKKDRWDRYCILSSELNNYASLVKLRFCFEKINGELSPVFKTYKDRYVVGQPREEQQKIEDYPIRNELDCPVIIKTSDGDLEVMLDGRFRLLGK